MTGTAPAHVFRCAACEEVIDLTVVAYVSLAIPTKVVEGHVYNGGRVLHVSCALKVTEPLGEIVQRWMAET